MTFGEVKHQGENERNNAHCIVGWTSMCVVIHLLFIPSQIQNSPVILQVSCPHKQLCLSLPQSIPSFHVAMYFAGAMLAKEGQWSQLCYLKLTPGLLGTFGILPICLEIFKWIEQWVSSFSYQFADILPPVAFYSLKPHYSDRAVNYNKQHIRKQAGQVFLQQSKAKKS